MKCSLHEIGKACGTSLGSIAAIEFYYPADLSATPKAYCLAEYASEPVFLFGKTAFPQKPMLNSAKLEERTNASRKAGDFVETTLTFSIRRIRLEAHQLAGHLQNRRIHVAVRDANGERYWLPNMRVQIARTTGQAFRDFNGYTFTLTSQRERFAVMLPPVVVVAPPPVGISWMTIGSTFTVGL